MKRWRLTDEQIAYAPRLVESGTAVTDVCRKTGIGEAPFYVWKKEYANLGTTEIQELRQLREGHRQIHCVTMLLLDLVKPFLSLSVGWGCLGGGEALTLASVSGNLPKSGSRCAESRSRMAVSWHFRCFKRSSESAARGKMKCIVLERTAIL